MQILSEKLSPATRLFIKRILASADEATANASKNAITLAKRAVNFSFRHVLRRGPVWQVPRLPELPAIDRWKERDARQLADEISLNLTKRLSDESLICSIIIPVFNKSDYTFQCLLSLAHEIDWTTTEVIIIDNGSTDRTKELLAFFDPSIRIIHNEVNSGFVDACNQGAAVARGKYLVFLNNDTTVLPGWLKNLVDTIESDPKVGAVGSILLYADGTIQEAGAIVWNDASVFHYGWGKSSGDRRFTFAREVDYCSGASLLVRKDLFHALSGFDRRFAPAYYEDVDLCFGVRALGYKVIYQPESRAIHYEGVTAGRNIETGIKHFQVVNREKLLDKWRELLERDHYEYNPENIEPASNRTTLPIVIVFDDRVPAPDRDAGSARMFSILTLLSKHCRVVFIYQSEPSEESYERKLWKLGIETANIVHYAKLIKKDNVMAAIVSRPEVAAALVRSIKKLNPPLKTIFDTVDINFVRLEREYELTRKNSVAKAARFYRRLETSLVRSCDQTWCVTADDRKALETEVRNASFEIVPTIHVLQNRGESFAGRKGLIFIGNFLHRPNVDAIHFFIREILPLVRKQILHIKVSIVGDHAPSEFLSYESESVEFTGYLADVDHIFQNSRVMIAPLRFGSGMKGKIGQALSYGLPVVTTSIGAEGMNLENEREAMIADSPREFANAIARVHEDSALWQTLSDNGYQHVALNFTPEVVAETISRSIKNLIATRE